MCRAGHYVTKRRRLLLKWECANKYLLAMLSGAAVDLGVTGKTRHADSAPIRHVLILSIEVSLFAFISLSEITYSDLTFDQSFWLALTHCVLGHVLLVRPLACVLNAVKTDIGAALPGMAWSRHAINIQDHTVQSNTE